MSASAGLPRANPDSSMFRLGRYIAASTDSRRAFAWAALVFFRRRDSLPVTPEQAAAVVIEGGRSRPKPLG